MFKNFAFVLAICISSQSLAAGFVSAKVTQISVDSSGKGMVYFAQPIGGSPAGCRHSSYVSALAFDSTTHGGKAILAMVPAAKASGDTVSAYGLGTCNVFGLNSAEDWDYGVVQ